MTSAFRTSAVVVVLIALLAVPRDALAQAIVGPEVWRTFAEKVETGKTLKVRLVNGQRFKATLLQVSPDGMTVQQKTRVPVPPELVKFTDIASLEVDTGKGGNLAKAVAIGAAVGAGAFFGLMMIAFAAWGD